VLPHGHMRMPSPQHRRHARPRRRRGRGRARRAAAAGGPGGRAGVAAAVHAARLDVPAGGRAGLRCRRAPRPPAAPARPPRAARARALAPQRAPGARRAGHPETRGRVLARLHAGGTSSSPQRMQCSVAHNPTGACHRVFRGLRQARRAWCARRPRWRAGRWRSWRCRPAPTRPTCWAALSSWSHCAVCRSPAPVLPNVSGSDKRPMCLPWRHGRHARSIMPPWQAKCMPPWHALMCRHAARSLCGWQIQL